MNERIEVQAATDIVGDEFMCLRCGYIKVLPKEYPERGDVLRKAEEHKCGEKK